MANVFYDGLMTPEECEAVRKDTGLYQIIVKLYNMTSGRMKAIRLTGLSFQDRHVYMGFEDGNAPLRVASIMNQKREYSVEYTQEDKLATAYSSWKTLIKSTRPSYVVTAMTKNPQKINGAAKTLSSYLTLWPDHIRKQIQYNLTYFKYTAMQSASAYARTTRHITVSAFMYYKLAKIVSGEATSSILTDKEAEVHQANTANANHTEAVRGEIRQRITQMFGREKWVLWQSPERQCILGAVDTNDMIEPVLEDRDSAGFAKITVPFKRYRTFKDIPDEYRRALEVQMMIVKSVEKDSKFDEDMFPSLVFANIDAGAVFNDVYYLDR